jgi:hypothetical protein
MSLIIKKSSIKTIKYHNYEKNTISHDHSLTPTIFRQQGDILWAGFYFQVVLMKVTIKLQY